MLCAFLGARIPWTSLVVTRPDAPVPDVSPSEPDDPLAELKVHNDDLVPICGESSFKPCFVPRPSGGAVAVAPAQASTGSARTYTMAVPTTSSALWLNNARVVCPRRRSTDVLLFGDVRRIQKFAGMFSDIVGAETTTRPDHDPTMTRPDHDLTRTRSDPTTTRPDRDPTNCSRP